MATAMSDTFVLTIASHQQLQYHICSLLFIFIVCFYPKTCRSQLVSLCTEIDSTFLSSSPLFIRKHGGFYWHFRLRQKEYNSLYGLKRTWSHQNVDKCEFNYFLCGMASPMNLRSTFMLVRTDSHYRTDLGRTGLMEKQTLVGQKPTWIDLFWTTHEYGNGKSSSFFSDHSVSQCITESQFTKTSEQNAQSSIRCSNRPPPLYCIAAGWQPYGSSFAE